MRFASLPLFFVILSSVARGEESPDPRIAAASSPVTTAASAPIVPSATPTVESSLPQKCAALPTVPARLTCAKIEEAKHALEKPSLRFVADARGKVEKREVALAVLAKDSDSPILIRLFTPLHPPAGRSFVPEVVGPSRFRVEHVRGQYAYKLTLRVFEEGAEVPVLAAKHIFIPPYARTSDRLVDLERARTDLLYVPMSSVLYHEDFFAAGLAMVRSDMQKAFAMLREKGVRSKAFPDLLIADRYDPEELVRVFAIEMTDPFRLYGLPLYGREQPPELELMKFVFAEVFVWGDDAFRHLCSSAKACGRLQFTNNTVRKGKKTYPGTYAIVAERCRGKDGVSVIEPDFWKGTADPINSAVAAACLLDMEFAELPKTARELYAREPRLGMVFPVIAYNAGGGRSAKVWKEFERTFGDRLATLSADTFDGLSGQFFLGTSRGKKTVLVETCQYVHKWALTWKGFRPKEGNKPDC